MLLIAAPASAHVGGAASVATPVTPAGACEHADADYVVRWTDNDERVTVAARISWSYTDVRPPPYWPGTPPVGLTGVTIASGIDERDPANDLVWDTSMVPAGAYFLWSLAHDPPFEMVTFAKGVVVVAHEGDPVWPSLVLTDPGDTVAVAHDSFELRFEACDPDGSARISFEQTPRYDGEDLVPVTDDVDPATGSLVWDTSQLCPGIRYVRATIEDARGLRVSNWARNGVSIDHGAGWDLVEHGCIEDHGTGGSGGGGGPPATRTPPRTRAKDGACGGGAQAALLLVPVLLDRKRRGR